MKKKFVVRNEENQRIVAYVGVERGYISITGEVYDKYMKYPSRGGCLHDEIFKYFPKLRKVIPFHLWNIRKDVPGGMYPIKNSLFHLIQKDVDIEYLKLTLHATDEEAMQIQSLVEYGLTPVKTCYGKSYDDENLRVYKNLLYKLGLPDRWRQETKEILEYIDAL